MQVVEALLLLQFASLDSRHIRNDLATIKEIVFQHFMRTLVI